jgi:hypothetical protein
MTDPRRAVHTAMVAAIVAKFTAQAYTSPAERVVIDPEEGVTPMPYVIVGNDTVIEFPTKTSEGGEVTHTLICWARTYGAGLTMANEVTQCLTDRTAMLAVTGFTTVRSDLEFSSPALKIDDPAEDEGRLYGFPIRFRFTVVQN